MHPQRLYGYPAQRKQLPGCQYELLDEVSDSWLDIRLRTGGEATNALQHNSAQLQRRAFCLHGERACTQREGSRILFGQVAPALHPPQRLDGHLGLHSAIDDMGGSLSD